MVYCVIYCSCHYHVWYRGLALLQHIYIHIYILKKKKKKSFSFDIMVDVNVYKLYSTCIKYLPSCRKKKKQSNVNRFIIFLREVERKWYKMGEKKQEILWSWHSVHALINKGLLNKHDWGMFVFSVLIQGGGWCWWRIDPVLINNRRPSFIIFSLCFLCSSHQEWRLLWELPPQTVWTGSQSFRVCL